MAQLTDVQLKSLDDAGFLRLPALSDKQEALRVRKIIERLFAQKAGEREGAYGDLAGSTHVGALPNSPQIMGLVNYAPELHKERCFQTAFQIARQILGEDTHFVMDMAIYKRPFDGAATPWHQDLAFRDPRFDYNEVTIWMALQDTDETSGCLMFLPGSHKGTVLEHTRTDKSGKSVALECVVPFEKNSAVAGSLPLGGCTIHYPGVLHCSTPNLKDCPRIAYIMTFGKTAVRSSVQKEFVWQDELQTSMNLQRQRWMRRGGFAITAWRRLRRGDLRSPRSLWFWTSRALRTLLKGK